MKNAFLIAGILGLVAIGLVLVLKKEFGVKANRPIEILRTSFRQIERLPDPAAINTAGKWYLLNHVSSSLIEYDHKNSSFLPLIAKHWDIQGAKYTFNLDPDAKFSDGTPIRARDVVATIKRVLAKKMSPHFPLWEHVIGCDGLKNLEQECSGIHGDDALGLVEVTLTGKSESFLLQISSPESGIWSADDIDPKTLELKPRRFSGPYSLESLEINADRELILTRNPRSKIQSQFPDSPRKILIKAMSRSDVEKAIVEKTADLFIGDFIPFNDHDWEKMDVGLHQTLPSSIIYFFKLNTDKRLGMDLLSAFAKPPDARLTFAETFLPFAPSIALTKAEVTALVPGKSSSTLVVAAPGFYFKDKFLSYLEETAKSVGVSLKIVKIDPPELNQLLESKEDFKSKYDFLIGSYVASERYPAVQLRYLTGKRTPKVSIDGIESPENDPEKIVRLKNYERWLLSSQTIVPLYFMRSHIVYRKGLDVGDQPVTDADIQLWRLTESADR